MITLSNPVKVGIAVAVAWIALCIIATYYGKLRHETNEALHHQTYSAWCKLECRTDLSYEEWKRMYDAILLKGQL